MSLLNLTAARSSRIAWTARVLATLAVTVAAMGATPLIAEQSPREYSIKAAFLYRFTGYVDWASTNDSDSDQPFTIGILGHEVFGDALDELTGKTVDGRPVVLERIQVLSRPAISGCEMLFVSSAAEEELDDILELLDDATILTVGDSKGFAERGGMIELRVHKNKIRFAINAQAAKRARIHIGARLLDLAERVY